MLIVLSIYAALVWLLFFKLKVLPWGRTSKISVGLIGLAIILVVLGLLNSLTPSGRAAVMSKIVEVAPVVGGTVAEVPVTANMIVEKGDVLLRLDKRPFQFAVDLAQANFDIASKTYERKSKAYEMNTATVSVQVLDESLSAMQAAEARLRIAKYELENTDILAPSAGEIASVRVTVGGQVPAMSGVMPLIPTDSGVIVAVFEQNGGAAIVPGAPVGLAFSRYPGQIHWTTVAGLAKGTSGGQVSVDSTLLDTGDVGSSSELLVFIDWPATVSRDGLAPGAIGSATVIGANAGPMGSLAKALLWMKAFTSYL